MNITQSKGFNTLVKTTVMPITMKGIKSISETPYGSYGNALAELIDNSWEKGYGTTRSEIISVFENKPYGKLKMIKVIDDGPGMDAQTIEKCFMIGSETEKGNDTLGLYGIGQKSACLWMANQYEVLTKKTDGELLSAVFNYEDGLHIGVVNDERAMRHFKTSVGCDHGTMVVLTKVKTERFKTRKSTFTETIKKSHGLIYSNRIKNGCKMYVNGEEITPIDFLNYDISTKLSKDNAVFNFIDIEGKNHEIPYEAWFSPSDNESDKNPKFLSRTMDNQGFITLRNERVVGIGQLFNVLGTKNNIYNGLKIILHMDGSLDSYFGISFGKTQKGQIMNDDIRDQFRKEFRRYFALASKYQNENIQKGEINEEIQKGILNMQEELAKNDEIQEMLNNFKCNAEIDGDVEKREKKDKKPVDTEKNNKKDDINEEKKRRKPKNKGKGKICGINFQFLVESRGLGSPYFIPEVTEKGICQIIINSSHNYYVNHFAKLNRSNIKNALILMFAEWMSIYGRGYQPDEETLATYMSGLQNRSDELQKLYKNTAEEIIEEYDEE